MFNNLFVLASVAAQGSSSSGAGLLSSLISLAIVVVVIAGYWRVFSKAGRPGWLAIIPIVNVIVILQIAGKPWWWIILLLIPLLNFIIIILVFIDFAKAFGQGVLFAIGLILLAPIFICILGFGNYRYIGV